MQTGTVIGTEHAQGLSWFEFRLAEPVLDRLRTRAAAAELEPADTLWTDYGRPRSAQLSELEQVLRPEIQALAQCLGQKALVITDAWHELGRAGSWHAPHTHGNRGYSAVVYLEFCSQQHAGLTWRLPENDACTGNERLLRPRVSTGSMLIWPSSWLHWTDPQTSDQRRLILSFNLRPVVLNPKP